MLPDWLAKIASSALSRFAQDVLTSLAAVLVTDGVITKSQEAGFIGSGFFLTMLLANFLLHKVHANVTYNNGVTDTVDAMQSADTISKGNSNG